MQRSRRHADLKLIGFYSGEVGRMGLTDLGTGFFTRANTSVKGGPAERVWALANLLPRKPKEYICSCGNCLCNMIRLSLHVKQE